MMNSLHDMLKPVSVCLCTILMVVPLYGQEPDQATSQREATLDSLKALHRSIETKQKQIQTLDTQIAATSNSHDRAKLTAESDKLKQDIDQIEVKFSEFALSVDTTIYDDTKEEPMDLQSELEKLVQPIVSELKNATATSREIDKLRTDLTALETKSSVASQAVERLNVLANGAVPDSLQEPLAELQTLWNNRFTDAENQRKASQIQLDSMMANRKSVIESTQNFLQNFFQTRGMNLLLGTLAFCGVFFGLRGLYHVVGLIRPTRKKRTFASRLVHLLFHVGTTLAAVCATLVVFNLVGDWFLLGIIMLFLLGVGWASINTVPQHIERIQLMLNIGPVRESERITFDGIPWRVDRLGFSAHLKNPLLEGGSQTLPIKYLIGLHSRPAGKKEAWFPCREGDWVELSDGRFGRVVHQSPSVVQIVELGGNQAVYRTESFLNLNPRNYSTGYRVELTFGIDYQHQAASTTTIPQVMTNKLEVELPSLLEPDEIHHLAVYLTEAGASALNYRVVIDLKGSAAHMRDRLPEDATRILVDACNENSWVIPFQQVTIHQADEQVPHV